MDLRKIVLGEVLKIQCTIFERWKISAYIQ
jgi:hypothetical protein